MVRGDDGVEGVQEEGEGRDDVRLTKNSADACTSEADDGLDTRILIACQARPRSYVPVECLVSAFL